MLVRLRSCNGLQGLALEWHVNLAQSSTSVGSRGMFTHLTFDK
jgi:hypothetical protein